MTQQEAIKQAIEKAQSNLEFRNMLMSNPESTLRAEFPGMEFSGKIELNLELSEDELDMVSGGVDDVMSKDATTTTTTTTTTSVESTSNAGKGGDHDNGHGNDADGTDESNPGNSGGVNSNGMGHGAHGGN